MEDRPIPGISLAATPSGTGCVECLSGDGPGWWLHLRRCAQCGHIGCCDSSPSQHASAHARTVGHPVVTSFEPGEDWFYEHATKKFFRGPRLPDPQSRPPEQPSPAPAEGTGTLARAHTPVTADPESVVLTLLVSTSVGRLVSLGGWRQLSSCGTAAPQPMPLVCWPGGPTVSAWTRSGASRRP